MALEFHGADDMCAPFPHRVLTKPERSVRTKKGIIHFPQQVFIICAECDHWITVQLSCDCPQRCHDLQELLASLPGDKVESG